MQRKIKAFVGADASEGAERAGHFFKALAGFDQSRRWCVDNGVALQKATNESINSPGGFLTPIGFDAAVIRVVDAVGAFRAGADVRPAQSDSQVRPRRFGGLTANFVAEGQSIPESNFMGDLVGTSQKKIAILARAPSELFEDAAPDLGEYIAWEVGFAFASVEDDCGFSGDGTSTYRGIQGLGPRLAGMKSAVSAASGHDTFAEIDISDLSSLMAGVLGSALGGAAWYTSLTGFALTICRIAGNSGGLVATRGPDGRLDINFLGFPVRISSKLPDIQTSLATKPMIYFGDLSMAAMITEARPTAVAISRDRVLDSDQYLVRGTRRSDIIVHDVGDASTRGPIAGLFGTS